MKNFIQILLILILAIISFNQCVTNKEFKQQLKLNELAEKDTVSYYVNKLGLEVAKSKSYKGTAEELESYLQNARDSSKQFAEATRKWRKIANALQIEIEFKVDSLEIPFNTPVNFEFTRSFFKQTDAYVFKGFVNNFGINIDARATATITPITGTKPTGLFSNDFRTEITSSNNLIRVKDFKNFNFTERKKHFGVGFSVGFGFYQGGFFLGPSINYNLIQF